MKPMEFAPQQNWELYRQRVAGHLADNLPEDDPSSRFERYAVLFDMIQQARPAQDNDRELLIERFMERAAERKRMAKIFQRTDELNRASESANNAG